MEALLELTEVDREVYRHAQARFERQVSEWTAASDPRDPSAEIPDAPAVPDLSFYAAIPGGGWLTRESHDGSPSFCWIGSANRAWLELHRPRGASSLVLEVAHAMDPEILAGLRISVDGRPVEHELAEADGAVIATARLKRKTRLGRQRPARVQLEVERSMRPSELDPASGDSRQLSIALRRAAFTRG